MIELSKYIKLSKSNIVDSEEWSDLLAATKLEELEELERKGGIMAEAVRKLKYFSQEEADRYWPEMIEKYEMDMVSNREAWRAPKSS